MLLEKDVKIISSVEQKYIDVALDACLRADWNNKKYNRYEETLKEGRLCTLPYTVRREEHRTYSSDQEEIIKSVQPLIGEITKMFPELLKVRGEVVNLLPGTQLELHIDPFWFHKYSRRIHIPILTNDRCFQVFEDREVHLEVGMMYEINNRILHSAYNRGESSRIHLIIDLMDKEKVAEARLNPGLLLSKE